jgi:hypothetical protein
LITKEKVPQLEPELPKVSEISEKEGTGAAEREEMNTTMKKDTTNKNDSDSPSGRDTEVMMAF